MQPCRVHHALGLPHKRVTGGAGKRGAYPLGSPREFEDARLVVPSPVRGSLDHLNESVHAAELIWRADGRIEQG